MEYENKGMSPFKISTIDDLLKSFAETIKSNSELCKNTGPIAILEDYTKLIDQNYGT